MKSNKYIIDAVRRYRYTSRHGSNFAVISALGCGMRRTLPLILEAVASSGSYAADATVSEIEITVTVPEEDSIKVMKSISSLISLSPKALDSHSKG